MMDKSSRNVLFLLLLAFAVRAVYLWYNIVVIDLAPIWTAPARHALLTAASDFGARPVSEAIEAYWGMNVKSALEVWHLNGRGLVLLYAVLFQLFGFATYTAVQIVYLLLDLAAAYFIIAIARRIGDETVAVVAGIIYAFFGAQIFMMANPSYDPWLTWGFITSTWAFLLLAPTRGRPPLRKRDVLLFATMFAFLFICNEFRTILALYGIAAAGWYILVRAAADRSLRLPRTVWQRAAAFLAVGCLVLIASSSINFAMRGEFSPVRSTVGHQFWTEVGQFANPFGLEDDDGSAAQFYVRESGKPHPSTVSDVAYNRWLKEKAGAFIRENPALYLSMVMRRALWILFPYKMPYNIVADYAGYNALPAEKERIAERLRLVEEHGRISWPTLTGLLRIDPGYAITGAVRVALALLLPFGYLSCFVFPGDRRSPALALLPIAYTLVTLSFFYIIPVVIGAAHAAAVPVAALGWCRFTRTCRSVGRLMLTRA